jgi:hypothetical protein
MIRTERVELFHHNGRRIQNEKWELQISIQHEHFIITFGKYACNTRRNSKAARYVIRKYVRGVLTHVTGPGHDPHQ